MSDHRLVFVGGLHRSGTTPLARCLAAHPQVSGFAGTGVEEDEGQHLQDVYPPAMAHGGPGRFALAAAAHLTEHSPLLGADTAARLLASWRPHWDLARPVLVEKSPPNLLMTRFLQAAFADARFVMVVRHPAIVSLSTRKWARLRSLDALLDHWFAAHRLLEEDAAHLHRLLVVKYEHLVGAPERTLAELGQQAGVEELLLTLYLLERLCRAAEAEVSAVTGRPDTVGAALLDVLGRRLRQGGTG